MAEVKVELSMPAVIVPMIVGVRVIVIVGALTFFPALSLGPILEHLLMQAGKTF